MSEPVYSRPAPGTRRHFQAEGFDGCVRLGLIAIGRSSQNAPAECGQFCFPFEASKSRSSRSGRRNWIVHETTLGMVAGCDTNADGHSGAFAGSSTGSGFRLRITGIGRDSGTPTMIGPVLAGLGGLGLVVGLVDDAAGFAGTRTSTWRNPK